MYIYIYKVVRPEINTTNGGNTGRSLQTQEALSSDYLLLWLRTIWGGEEPLCLEMGLLLLLRFYCAENCAPLMVLNNRF